MDKETLHLWYAYPDDLLDEKAAQACARVLSDDERARWQRFKFEKHRREYLATHALARIALSHSHALPPEAWQFRLNAYGKPSINPECGLRFNLSNSQSLVICLISEGAEVGVDVEACARARTICEVGPRVFSPKELAQLEALHEDERPERALRLWTLKEAYIKARGMGLALPLNKFSFLFEDANSIRMEMDPTLNDSPERWRFYLFEHAAHCIALMVENRDVPQLNVWETRLLPSAPTRLATGREQWFPVSEELL
ncbi:MAG: 4'-phosphopantetheinyl transferase family protein [Terracidiphilus sp.]